MKKIFLTLLLLFPFVFLTGCDTVSLDDLTNFDFSHLFDFNQLEPADLKIYAPMSLRSALEELIPIFEDENEGLTVTADYGTAAEITKNLKDQMGTDLVITTSQKQFMDLQNEDLVDVSTKEVFATNALVLFSKATSELTSIDDLSTYNVQQIIIGDPEKIPCGQYAVEALTNLGLYESLRYKITEVNSVSDILSTVEDTRSSCGIVYKSDVTGNEAFKIITNFPDGSYTPVPYAAAITKSCQYVSQTKVFEDFLLSDQAKSILSSYGFDPSAETVQDETEETVPEEATSQDGTVQDETIQ